MSDLAGDMDGGPKEFENLKQVIQVCLCRGIWSFAEIWTMDIYIKNVEHNVSSAPTVASDVLSFDDKFDLQTLSGA